MWSVHFLKCPTSKNVFSFVWSEPISRWVYSASTSTCMYMALWQSTGCTHTQCSTDVWFSHFFVLLECATFSLVLSSLFGTGPTSPPGVRSNSLSDGPSDGEQTYYCFISFFLCLIPAWLFDVARGVARPS